MAVPDGSIFIDTKIKTEGFNAGTKKLSGSASNALNNLLLRFATVGVAVRGVFDGVVRIASGIANLLKKVLLGAFVIFALSFQKIFQTIRESMADVLKLRGGEVAKQVENIQNSFEELKAAVAAAFLPLLIAAIPYIQKAIDWLTQMFNRVAMITAAFLGQKEVLQIVQGSAAKLAKNTEKTRKSAQGALAAFDQINVLTKQATETTAPAAPKVEGKLVPIDQKTLDLVDAVKGKIQELKDRWQSFVDSIVNSEPWKRTVAFIKAEWEDIKRAWARTVEFVKSEWADVQAVLGPAWQRTKDFLVAEWADLQVAWQRTVDFVKNEWNTLANFGSNTWQFIKDDFGTIADFFKTIWQRTVEFTKVEWENIKQIPANIKKFIQADFTSLANWFGTIWNTIKSGFQTAFTGIKDFARNTFNSIIDFINRLIRGIVSGINTVISAANTVSSLIPGFQPMQSITAPQVPRLATGAVIPPNSQFLAVLGDQKSGTNIEAPADLIRSIIREELGNTGQDVNIPITLTLDGEVIHRNQKRVSMRHGKSLLAGGTV